MTDLLVLAAHTRLVARARTRFQAICHTDGTDPEIELIEARVNGWAAGEWMTARILHAQAGWAAPAAAGGYVAVQWMPDDMGGPWLMTIEAFATLVPDGDPNHAPWSEVLDLIALAGTDPDGLTWLAGHRDQRIAVAVARHTAAPVDAVRHLAGSGDRGIRATVAQRAYLPDDVVERLANDPIDAVRAVVRARTSRDPGELRDLFWGGPSVDLALVRNPATPADVLAELYDRRGSLPEGFLRDVAAHPNTPDDVLLALTRERADIRLALAGRTALPADAYKALAADPAPGVVAALTTNVRAVRS